VQPIFTRATCGIAAAALLLTACAPSASPQAPSPQTGARLTVAAAADLQFAFTDIGKLFEQQTGNRVTFVFGSTGQLAQQIENGAPYDMLAAANVSYVDDLAAKGLALKDSVALYARGRIVIAVNKQSGVAATKLEDLLANNITHIAIANPAHAPYGMAAMQALQSAGLWDKLQPRLVYGENVRQALQYVQSGEAEAGIVALSVANVPEITWTLLDDALHKPLDQALAVMTSSKHPDLAKQFIAFVGSAQGHPIMRQYGFLLPDEINVLPAPKP
jgi:molybdate transport system substrate-binding protein